MQTYFDTLPQDLINEILIRYDTNDLIEYEELFKINYEHLMILKYREFHQEIKDLMKFDKNLRKYSQSWKLIYLNSDKILYTESHGIFVGIYKIDSAYVDLVSSIKLKKDYEM